MPRKTKDKNVIKRLNALERENQKIDLKSKIKAKNESSFNTNTSTIPQFDILNAISKGTDDDEMVGSSIVLRSISYKMLLHSNSTDKSQLIRYAIVRIKGNTTFTSNGEKMFKDVNGDSKDYSATTEQEKFFLPINRDTMDVIDTNIVKLGAKNITYGDQYSCNQIVKGYKSYKGKKLNYTSNATPVDKYYFLMWSMASGMDTTSTSWAQAEVTGRVAFTYSDE